MELNLNWKTLKKNFFVGWEKMVRLLHKHTEKVMQEWRSLTSSQQLIMVMAVIANLAHGQQHIIAFTVI